MTHSNNWSSITGPDKKLKTPNQQAEAFNAVADYTVVHPYGLYCDLPPQTLAVQLRADALMGVTQARPADCARGEPAFYHPQTGTRIIPRANGNLDVLVGTGGGAVNIVCTTASISASGGITLDGDTQINGNLSVDGDFTNTGAAQLGGAGGQPIARKGDATNGSSIVAGSPQHTAT